MRITERLDFDNIKENPIKELKKADLPILIYGGGSFARDIMHYLKVNGIDVWGVFVDDGGFILHDILEKYEVIQVSIHNIDFPCYVVMGMANYLKGQTIVNENVKKVFYLSFYPYGDSGTFSKSDIEANVEDYQLTYNLLEDDFSQKCMVSYLNSRIKNDVSCIFSCYEHEQTYFDNTVFSINKGENYIDIGAYTGDTIELFYESCGREPGKIWAFEGNPSFEPAIKEIISKLGIEDSTDLFVTGLWSSKKKLYFSRAEHNMEEGTITDAKTGLLIDADTVDNILKDRKEKADIIKINFANADEVLKGCQRIISEDRPKIAIVVGFFNRLVCDIPKIIKEIDASYKVYLRFNSAIPARLVMYAVPN